MSELLSINQAVEQGIERLRKPIWVCPMDHLKLDIRDGACGPWLHLYAPFNKECNGRDPVDMLAVLCGDLDEPAFLPYTGPLPDSEEYKQAAAAFAGCLSPETP